MSSSPVDVIECPVSGPCCALADFHAPDRVIRARCYASDLTDAQWAVLEPLLPAPSWLAGAGGRPEKHCRRVMIDAVLYVVDNGIKWRALPADFPGWACVYAFFARFAILNRLLPVLDRAREQVRRRAGRHPWPSAGCLDSQSVKAAETVGADQRGVDGYKKVGGRKRHILTDTLGLLVAVAATPANTCDQDGADILLAEIAVRMPSIGTVFVDGGYQGMAARTGGRLGIDIEITHRPEGVTTGFARTRWVVERTLAWTCQHRRCVRDYERLAGHHEAMVIWAALMTMTHRLAKPVKPG
jgi:transposase